LIRSLEFDHRPAGFYLGKDRAVYWDGKNDQSEQVTSGIYFYRLDAGSFRAIRKLVISE
jgi:hypothetical protein